MSKQILTYTTFIVVHCQTLLHFWNTVSEKCIVLWTDKHEIQEIQCLQV